MKKNAPLQTYHYYEGRECTARFPIHTDGGGWWITGPITVNEDGKTWDHSKENDVVIARQPTKAKAVNLLRRKLGEPPPGMSPGEGWATLDAERKAQKMSLKQMANAGLLESS